MSAAHTTAQIKITKHNGLRVASGMLVIILAFNLMMAATPITAHQPSRGHAEKALHKVPGLLQTSDQTRYTSNRSLAIRTNTVHVPRKATQAVTFGTGTDRLQVQLPSNGPGNAQAVAKGIVTYGKRSHFTNAVQAEEQGGIRMLTILDSPNAPTHYDYKLRLPRGGKISVLVDGSVLITNRKGQFISSVATPWAKDANGNSIQTHFTANGQTLTQHVNHRVPGTAYPVVADPAWAVAASFVTAAATMCAHDVIQDFGISGIRWIIKRGSWSWKNKLEDAVWSCSLSVASAGMLRFAPKTVKTAAAKKIKVVVWRVLKWKI